MLGAVGWVLIAALGYFIYWVAQPDPVPFLGVYSRPGKWYWLKFRLMKLVIALRQRSKKNKKSGDAKKEDLMNSQWGGDGGIRDISELDKKHDLPKDKKFAGDCVFFDGSNRDGWYFTLGTAQRHDDIINLFLIIRVPGFGTFVDDKMQIDTNAKSIQSKNEWKTASGFSIECIKPMEEWRLSFKGKLLKSRGACIFSENGEEDNRNKSEIPIDAEFEIAWTNFGDYFDFDTECSPTAIAHSLAIEPWSRELFDRMRASHQTHYEQFGFINGSFKIGNQTWDGIKLTSMRDHTITGYRRWSDIRRFEKCSEIERIVNFQVHNDDLPPGRRNMYSHFCDFDAWSRVQPTGIWIYYHSRQEENRRRQSSLRPTYAWGG
ncbi:hypothetical protein WR25_07723 isoform B [Diploscapter pachys]|uniref:Uncharacterized protein n=1 Tax=Diploscapter pachys TaxID=2018661 RepID=A0A2A2KIV9_9BILA|nr:hypothetical protein WR25_07723 isoform B [Diploscapter pachys]